ncbi:Holliday junction branch migration protein RuvA [Candidatus Ishikawella capsulata]|uniref:Holliday junction branch migration complex subunit RuvA n=1 Tax=Candidatus Ishikawaella capsulata Mpkobe TaxID=476281 RepID=C5WCN3_9ENTR|nr:Holliday junction branch migration protein RuvA [Candidatus Ishikawaella capsulata]BAH83089.1 Holliday junction DNA helicase motor protein [Candidatus Ishikawaella capsulata Mpkobe]
MISFLRGNIIEKKAPWVLLEVNGIGYEINMPITCFNDLPDLNQETLIFTHFIIREDLICIFGFQTIAKRTLFRNLIKINGVGCKLALIILSNISPQQFINVIEERKVSLLEKIPGIGKKIAERILIEMRDLFKKKSDNLSTSILEKKAIADDAIKALIALGYKPKEAHFIITKVHNPNMDCKTLICAALKKIYEVKNEKKGLFY